MFEKDILQNYFQKILGVLRRNSFGVGCSNDALLAKTTFKCLFHCLFISILFQTILFSLQDVMIELYRRQVWHDAKTVNVITTACFTKFTKVSCQG